VQALLVLRHGVRPRLAVSDLGASPGYRGDDVDAGGLDRSIKHSNRLDQEM
jgi:hypothetical protein